MKCRCENNCINSINEINQKITDMYLPCDDCNTRTLKKAIPIKRQVKLDEVDGDYKRCQACNKRHMDFVMAHILKILIKNDLADDNYSIRKVGTPLINPAIYLESLPYLHERSLVIIIKDINQKAAEEIYNQVREIKAVLKGDIHQTIGQITADDQIHNYELMAGCDIRCDIQDTPEGPLYLYKQQSKIHIEYPKKSSPKIEDLDKVLEKYDNPTVIDAMCGCGTLGIYALKKNAKKVIFNDIYNEAIDALKTNLKINNCNPSDYEIYNENMDNLSKVIDEKYDVGIIDNFPQIDSNIQKQHLEKICKEVIVI